MKKRFVSRLFFWVVFSLAASADERQLDLTDKLSDAGKNNALAIAARGKPNQLHDSRMIWLPVAWKDDKPVLHGMDK